MLSRQTFGCVWRSHVGDVVIVSVCDGVSGWTQWNTVPVYMQCIIQHYTYLKFLRHSAYTTVLHRITVQHTASCTGSKLSVSSAVRDCMSAMQMSQHGITHHIKRLMFLRTLHMTRKTVPRRRITSKGCESGIWLTGKLQQKIC